MVAYKDDDHVQTGQPQRRRPHLALRRRGGRHREAVCPHARDRRRSRFDWLREPDPDAVATPPMFMVFDLLHHAGRDLIGRPLRERRARLEQVVADNDLVLPVRRLARNGFVAWSEVVAHDYEGLVAKDEASLYEAGPTRRWLKVKQKGWTVEEDRWQRRIRSRA
jgi:ATP-dependent DNA ligase